MFTFGGLVHKIDARYSAGPKATPLVREALRLVSRYPGGVSGFIRRLRAAGYTVETASWLSGGDPVPLSGEEVEETLGCDTIARIAARAEISQSFARTLLGYAIPNVVALLVRRGNVPARIRASAMRFIRISPARPPFQKVENPRNAAKRSGASSAIAPLLAGPAIPWATALIAAGSLLGYFVGAGDHGAAPESPVVAQNAPAPPFPEASLLLPLPYGKPAAVSPPDLSKGAAEAAAALSASRGEGQSRASRLAPDFPVIYFASGRAKVPAGSRSLLDQTARLVRQLPAGSRAEIAGYTDRTGSPAANLRLSQQRARAVLEALSRAGAPPARLTAKGYGVHLQTAAGQAGAPEGRSNALAEETGSARRVEFHIILP